ncbi:hypothetical protein EUX98_g7017 [Antrodiella citrinella]|uniref:Uncharacterized protein n=1 Tax=Antrodiella citrinella TaxID=2447956 RepID=A0A4V3XHY5_9APHY|nr:hypothetical protein EUX98_g7017 [Antrodiella citrinella]
MYVFFSSYDRFAQPFVDFTVLLRPQKWEAKVIQSHVAEFEAPPPQAAHPSAPPPPQHSYPPHPIHAMHNAQYPPASGAYNPYGAPPPGPHIKAEPVDGRYMLSGPPPPSAYAIPSLPGPQIHRPPSGPAPPAPTARLQYTSATNGAAPARIPQVDGPSSSSSDSPSPPPSQSYVPPRALHPSLPQPAAAAAKEDDDEEAINSDLDDSDSDGERDADTTDGADTDIVFCTYDKVARVKNKWKCVLKDGMIHVNGKDYLFAKCTGEFEW